MNFVFLILKEIYTNEEIRKMKQVLRDQKSSLLKTTTVKFNFRIS